MTLAHDRLAAEAEWWINHEALMDYAQVRPVPLSKIKEHQKCATDCSGFVYGVWHALGFPDPTGGEYTSGDVVYTGTLLSANDAVKAPLQVGDLAIFASSESTTHVAFVLEAGEDPWLASHGSEAGPGKIRLSVEAAWHRAHGAPYVHYRRTSLPGDKPPRLPVWDVRAGDGTLLGKTHYPRLWTAHHRHLFKDRQRVTYRRMD